MGELQSALDALASEDVGSLTPRQKLDRQAAALEQGIDACEVDRTLAAVAAGRHIEQLSRVVQHYLSRLDPDGPEPDPTDERSLALSTSSDGTVVVRGQLDPLGGEKLRSALESLVQADRPEGGLRTRAQQTADAMVGLADNQLTSGDLPFLRTVEPNVVGHHPGGRLPRPGDRSGCSAYRVRQSRLGRDGTDAGLATAASPRSPSTSTARR